MNRPSNMYILAEHLYKKRLFDDDKIKEMVKAHLLTEKEYKLLTGKEFVPYEA